MANYHGGYVKVTIDKVLEEPTSVGYDMKLANGGKNDLGWLTDPADLDNFLRPIARFKEGTKVLASVDGGRMPGKVEKCYHPNWVYAIRLDRGGLVYAPEDIDMFVQKA